MSKWRDDCKKCDIALGEQTLESFENCVRCMCNKLDTMETKLTEADETMSEMSHVRDLADACEKIRELKELLKEAREYVDHEAWCFFVREDGKCTCRLNDLIHRIDKEIK